MTTLQFVLKSFFHYLRYHVTVTVGVVVSTAVLTGALIIGDSIRHSLEQTAYNRLGKATFVITAGDRYFTTRLATDLHSVLNIPCTPLLQTEGIAVTGGGKNRINKIQVLGINESFNKITGGNLDYGELTENNIIINETLADELGLKAGDSFLLRIRKTGLIPLNAPFVSDVETTVALNVIIQSIAGTDDLGTFNLKNSQVTPFNVFINLDYLNQVTDLEGKSNTILIASADNIEEQEIVESINNIWDPEDANLKIREITLTDELELVSERVFIDPVIAETFRNDYSEKRYILTYFVNTIRKGNKVTPYSFVSTLDENILEEDEIIVNSWLAEDLNLTIGDTIEMTYFIVGPLRQLDEDSAQFRVKEIVSLAGKYNDPTLMPFLPGLSDAGHCRDWEAGIPIDLTKIRDKDEDYWYERKGTPKAFVSIKTAVKLWQNRFGNYTSIRFMADHTDYSMLQEIFQNSLDPVKLGFKVRNAREEALNAARNGVDFSQLFIGLSFFVLVSSILLTGLLFLLNISSRTVQAGTLSALGFSDALINKLFLLEGSIIILIGALLGTLLAIIYNRLILFFLNHIWFDIVRTSVLEIDIKSLTLFTGFLISVVIALATILLTLRKKLAVQTIYLQKGIIRTEAKWLTLFKNLSAFITGLACLIIILIQFTADELSTLQFFLAGGFLLISLLLIADICLKYFQKGRFSFSKMHHLSIRNIVRNRKRSYAIIILFALGTFIIVATGSNRKDMTVKAHEKSSGTGGYQYFAESTIPVLKDLNNKKVMYEYGIEGEYSLVQFRKNEGDDASCLNLNRITNPVLLGVDPLLLNGRFSFVKNTNDLDKDRPWESLQKVLPGGLIPAISDQTIIQWGLGLKMGDTLFYKNARGDTLTLKLIGGLAPSVFQGNVIISNDHFLRHFPTSSGSSVFLIEGSSGEETDAAAEFFRAFRDHGWQMTETTTRLAEFYSVENTYLSIFFMLGILGLIIGTIGLGIVLAHSIMERKSEISLLQALGYKQPQIYRIVFTEHFFLLLAGIIIGIVSAIISTLPSLISSNTDVSVMNIIYLLIFLILNSFLWIGLFTRFNIGKVLVKELRAE